MAGAPAPAYISIHEQRIKLVADAIVKHSALDQSAATELARHVLYVLDHISEKVR
jgi:hypothetical protein